MQIFDFHQLYNDPQLKRQKTVISIGVYDGFHYGHQRVINSAVNIAKKEEDTKVAVFTFSKNPKTIIGRNPYKLPLMSLRQSTQFFEKLGVDYLVVIDFSVDISKLTGEEFIGRCCSMFDVQNIVVGEDFRCGHKADTGVNELHQIVKKLCKNATVEVPATYKLSDGSVDSSTLVRQNLTQGKVATILSLLGRYYALDLCPMPYSSNQYPVTFESSLFVQLLPPPGRYETLLVMEDSSKYSMICEIDEKHLELKGDEFSKRANKKVRYENLQFVKELT